MDVDKWTLEDIIDACSSNPTKKRKLLIPKFQRRRVWTQEKEDELIETLKLGNISIGVLQLWKIGSDDGYEKYLLVDGLHRSSTLTKYYDDPFSFGKTKKAVLEIINEIAKSFQTYKREDIESCCFKWFNKKMLGTYEEFVESKDYAHKYDELKEIIKIVADKKDKEPMIKYIMEKTKELSKVMNISKSKIPVILNAGNLNDLAVLFKRINQNGTPLSLCDVLAAVWINTKIKIQNQEIVDCISDHYKDLKQENNNMDIYMINDDKTFTVYEYMIGLKRYLLKKYENTFLNLIKDKEFIFKLVSCCYYEDIGKKSIEKLNTTLIGENLTDLEKNLEWSIEFISKTFDKITIHEKKLIIKEVPIYIAMITLAFNEKKRISKKEKYYSNLFVINMINDKLSDRNFNTKIIKSVVTEKRYLNKIYKAELIEKMNRFVSDSVKLFGKNDRQISTTTKIILTSLNNIYNEPDIEVKFGNIITKKIILDKDKKSTLPLNCIGNVCLYTIGEHDRKTTQTILNYLHNEGVSDNDIEETIMFMDNEPKFDNILLNTSDFEKTKYLDFVKFRGKKIKEKLLEAFKENMKDDSDDEDSNDTNSDADDDKSDDSDNDSSDHSDHSDDETDNDQNNSSDDSDKSESNSKSKSNGKSNGKANGKLKDKLNNKSDLKKDKSKNNHKKNNSYDSDDEKLTKKSKKNKTNYTNSSNDDQSENSEDDKPKKIIKKNNNRTSIKIE